MTTPRDIILDHWPYVVAEHHMDAYQYRMLRLHGQYVAAGPKGVTAEQLQELDGFYETLADQVIMFNPSTGWSYRPRDIWDEDLLIGVNEHTRLTEDGAEIWQFPPAWQR
jgi:hypothetical protein